MSMNGYIRINNKMIKSTDLTYDQLISVSKQYVEENGKLPVQGILGKYNLPGWNSLKIILDRCGKTKLDYYQDLGCDNYEFLSRYMTEEQRNQAFFPLELPSGIIIYYDFSDNPDSYKMHWIHCYDQDGYRYYTKRQLMQHCQIHNNIPDRFRFDNKIYLEYNINHMLELNNCIYRVYNLPENCGGHDQISLISKYGDIATGTVHYIQNNLFRYSEEGRLYALKREKTCAMTKEEVLELVKKKCLELGRPLILKDLKTNDLDNYIGKKIIIKYWGSFSNMMKEVSLDDGKPFSAKRIHSNNGYGINYYFSDGELAKSSFEYDFSLTLRNNGFIFNKTFFRDIKYSDIDSDYTGKMNCDYVLIIDNVKVYIEFAGILYCKSDVDAFYNNTIIQNSNLKERYRNKLVIKKQLLQNNNVIHKIVFPYELNQITYQDILNDCLLMVRKKEDEVNE